MSPAGNTNTWLILACILLSFGNFLKANELQTRIDEFITNKAGKLHDESVIILMHGGRIALLEERVKILEEKYSEK